MAGSIKISQISKDLNLATKEVIDIFSKELNIDKKNGGNVDTEEFELFMQKLTLASQIKDLDSYTRGVTSISPKSDKKPAAKPKRVRGGAAK